MNYVISNKFKQMALNFSTSIILPETCLIRGSSDYDKMTPTRWFGYYGLEKDIDKFCSSKKFVTKYAKKGYQYYKVKESLHLLTMPYISLFGYDDEDARTAFTTAIHPIRS